MGVEVLKRHRHVKATLKSCHLESRFLLCIEVIGLVYVLVFQIEEIQGFSTHPLQAGACTVS